MSAANSAIVEVNRLSKLYTRDLRRSLRYGVQDIMREFTGRARLAGTLRPDEFVSLDEVSFSVGRGDALAVVGANAAGKTTLLKILHGLIKPDGGHVRIRGRVGAMIELGAGFDPILTGRENIATQGLVIGLGPREIREYTERVIEFSELPDAIDTPVRYYSSGMSARLSFAVAAQMNADLLLVDEVLAVGDLAFQRKCIAHLLRFLSEGGSLIFVSHSVHQMQAVCTRGLLLEHGRCVYQGSVTEAIGRHLEAQRRTFQANVTEVDHSRDPVRVVDVAVVGLNGDEPRNSEPAEIVISYDARDHFEVIVVFTCWTADSLVCVSGTHSAPIPLDPGPGEIRARIDRLPLMAGGFTLRAAIIDAKTTMPLGLLGFEDTPRTVSIAGGDGPANALETIQQLTSLEATWQ